MVIFYVANYSIIVWLIFIRTEIAKEWGCDKNRFLKTKVWDTGRFCHSSLLFHKIYHTYKNYKRVYNNLLTVVIILE